MLKLYKSMGRHTWADTAESTRPRNMFKKVKFVEEIVIKCTEHIKYPCIYNIIAFFPC